MKLIARLMNAYTNLGLTDIEKEFTELFESWLHENNTALSPSLLANIKDFAQLYWHIFNIQMVPAKGMIINFIYHFDEENSIEPESIQTKIYTVNSQQKVSVKSIINFNQEDNFFDFKENWPVENDSIDIESSDEPLFPVHENQSFIKRQIIDQLAALDSGQDEQLIEALFSQLDAAIHKNNKAARLAFKQQLNPFYLALGLTPEEELKVYGYNDAGRYPPVLNRIADMADPAHEFIRSLSYRPFFTIDEYVKLYHLYPYFSPPSLAIHHNRNHFFQQFPLLYWYLVEHGTLPTSLQTAIDDGNWAIAEAELSNLYGLPVKLLQAYDTEGPIKITEIQSFLEKKLAEQITSRKIYKRFVKFYEKCHALLALINLEDRKDILHGLINQVAHLSNQTNDDIWTYYIKILDEDKEKKKASPELYRRMGGQFGFIKEALNYYIKYPFESRFLGKYCAIETNDVCREEMLTYRKNFGASSLLEGLLNHVSVIDLLNFSNRWHENAVQSALAHLFDMDGRSWETLIPPTNVPGEQGGYIISLKNKVELWEEGNKLEHCSSTYAVKCFKQPYFVLSERNNLGEPISTFEVFLTNDPTKEKNQRTIKLPGQNYYLTLIQHSARGNSEPNIKSQQMLAWFFQQVETGEIKIDAEAIMEAREKRLKLFLEGPFENKALLDYGYNPLDEQKLKKVCDTSLNVLQNNVSQIKTNIKNNYTKIDEIIKTLVHQKFSQRKCYKIKDDLKDYQYLIDAFLQSKERPATSNGFRQNCTALELHQLASAGKLSATNFNLNDDAINGIGETALFLLMAYGHHAILEIILRDLSAELKKFYLNQTNIFGETGLFLAAAHGHIAMVTLLLEHDASTNQYRCDGLTPLHIALHNGHIEIAGLLIDHLVKKRASVNLADIDAQIPLQVAVEKGHLACVKQLWSTANIFVQDSTNNNILITAAHHGHTAIVNFILSQKQLDANYTNNNGHTAVMQAAANGHIDTVRLLIEANASLLKIAANGDTALQLAQKRKDPSLIQLVAFHTYLQRAEKKLAELEKTKSTRAKPNKNENQTEKKNKKPTYDEILAQIKGFYQKAHEIDPASFNHFLQTMNATNNPNLSTFLQELAQKNTPLMENKTHESSVNCNL